MHQAEHVRKAVCLFAKPFCSCAGPCVHLQKRHAYVHSRLFICRSLCTCARLRVYLQRRPACMQGGVFVCKGTCIRAEASCSSAHGRCMCAERRVYLHAQMHACMLM